MAKNMNFRKIVSVLLTIVMLVSIAATTVSAADIIVSSKVEYSGQSSISISGYNAVVIKQSQASIVWVGGEYAGDGDVGAAVAANDPSVSSYVVVSGSGPFYFSDYWSGNQYKNTYFTVGGGAVNISGDYSHISLFKYDIYEEEPTTEAPVPSTSTEAPVPSTSTEAPVPSTSTEPPVSSSVPETTVPPVSSSVPETTVPPVSSSVPDTTVPSTSAPQTTVPSVTVPETTVPSTTVPAVSEPEEVYIPMLLGFDGEEIEIPDEEVPLAEEPEEPSDEIEILDEDVPLADVPETGDISILWAAMSVLSGGGIVAINSKKTKKEENE